MNKYHKGYTWCEHCDSDDSDVYTIRSFRYLKCSNCGGKLSKSINIREIIEIVCTKILNSAEWDPDWHEDDENIDLFANYINCNFEQIYELLDRSIRIRGVSRCIASVGIGHFLKFS